MVKRVSDGSAVGMNCSSPASLNGGCRQGREYAELGQAVIDDPYLEYMHKRLGLKHASRHVSNLV